MSHNLVNLENITYRTHKSNPDNIMFSFCSNNDTKSISALYNSFCRTTKDITGINQVNLSELENYFDISAYNIFTNLKAIIIDPENISKFKEEYQNNLTLYNKNPSSNDIKTQYDNIKKLSDPQIL